MQNSYFFYKALVVRLSDFLKGSVLVSSFSQDKDELVLEFNDAKKSVFIRIVFSPELSIVLFPERYRRAKNNSAEIFSSALSGKFKEIRIIENERTFIIEFDNGSRLLFLMHGASGNIVYESENIREVFRKSVSSGKASDEPASLRTIDWSLDTFLKHKDNIEKYYFLFGKEIWKWLRLNGYDQFDDNSRHQLIQKALELLNQSHFYLCRENGAPFFSMLPFDSAEDLGSDPVHAINSFYQVWVREKAYHALRKNLLKRTEARIKRLTDLSEKNRARLIELSQGNNFREWADLIMAHLHTLKQGVDIFKAERFSVPGEVVEIRIKPELTPQKNAEVYYRKARNREEEMSRLAGLLYQMNAELEIERDRLRIISECADLESLRTVEDKIPVEKTGQQQAKRSPYIESEFLGYRILIGRSSTDNDELTFKIAAKEDLWLHVRDVAGSHVIIRNQPGKTIPGPVKERAASLAAYHSKRKGESLCPVACTKRKYVRKRKGDPPGMVVVEREEVLMVVPAP